MQLASLLLILVLAGCFLKKPEPAPAPTTVVKPATQTTQEQPANPAPKPTVCKPCPNDSTVAALKEQLAKTTAELERIKKRLANPE